MLRHEVDGLIAVNPKGGKEARAHAVSPQIEAGNVYLPILNLPPWRDSFIEECAVFPNGAHDDQVDSMTQALLRLKSGRADRSSLGGIHGGPRGGRMRSITSTCGQREAVIMISIRACGVVRLDDVTELLRREGYTQYRACHQSRLQPWKYTQATRPEARVTCTRR